MWQLMKTNILLLLLFSLISFTGFCKVWVVSNSYYTFTPNTLTISLGDTISFEISSSHNANEVSEATWNVKGNTSLDGGFLTPFGGGMVLPEKLGVGIHYYVCSPHAAVGMIGKIIVESVTGIDENQLNPEITIFPNPTSNFIMVNTNNLDFGTPYSIANIAGSHVMAGKLNNKSTKIDISYFPNGVYLILIGDNRKQSFKILKK